MKKWMADDIQSLDNKVAVVTGANSGIGYEAARVLANKSATVILAVRSTDKGLAAVKRIKQQNSAAKVKIMQLDLSDLTSVGKFAANFKKEYSQLDILINNAGVMVPPYSKTKDGFELQFGTNHLGHFALTGLLINPIVNTPDSRIVNVSSIAHKGGNLDFNDLQWESRKYKPWNAYGDSKIANLYFTYELARLLQQAGHQTRVAAAHPGWTATELQRNSGTADFFNRFFAQEPEMGALPSLFAATADIQSGDFIGPCGFMEMRGYPKKGSSNKRSKNPEIAKRLWSESEKLTNVRYGI